MTRPVAVAITGGIGAGKSEALRAFRRCGAATVSSDEIVHELLRHDEVKQAIVERFGEGVGAPTGARPAAIADVVFDDREALTWLEALLHPLVSREYLTWRDQLGELSNPPRVAVTEVPLLYESGGEERFDKVVVITAPEKLRRMRSQSATDKREQRPIPDRERFAKADYSYANTGTPEELEQFVRSVMDDLTR